MKISIDLSRKLKLAYYCGREVVGLVSDLSDEKYSKQYFEQKVDSIKRLGSPSGVLERMAFYCGTSAGVVNLFFAKITGYE